MLTLRQAMWASTAIACAMTAPAIAQDTAAAAPASADTTPNPAADEGQIAEITVTARRREESLQNTPVTVTAFTAEELQARGINDVSRLIQATPGVNFDVFPKTAPRPFFRGIGSSNQGAGGDPSSVAFLDGVYLARAGMLGIDFYDMQRIEVLKGPQGTLFGKNVVGGAINFITNKPVAENEVSAQLTVGQYEQLNGNLMVNARLSDTIAVRTVLGAISNDGFRHTVDGHSLDDENKKSARIQAAFGLNTDTTLFLSADIASQDVAQGARYNVKVLPFHPTGSKKGYDDFDKPRVSNPDQPGGTDATTGGLRAEFVTDKLGFASLTATAAWRTLKFDNSEDFDGTTAAQNAASGIPVSGIRVIQNERADSYSAETRLNSNSGGPLTWVAGLYWNHDNIERVRESLTSVTPTTINQFTGHSRNRSYAAYGELQYDFGNGFGVFGGARYTDERKEYESTRLTGPRATPVVNYTTVGTPGIARAKLATYRVGAQWRANDNLFAFASVSTGFKSGAFPETPSSAILARTPTAPEKVTNYEAGLKTDWLDRRLRFNVTGFIAKYRNFQTIQAVPDATLGPGGTSVSIDTGDATIKGIETELMFVPVKWFDLTARYAYLDATFDQLTQTTAILANGSPVRRDLSGNRLSRTPKHALNAEAGFTTPYASWGWLRAAVGVDHQSEIFDDNDNDFIEYRRPRTLWDASLTYHINDDFSAQAWVHNLTDKEYRVHQADTAGGLFVLYGAPRQYGLTFNTRF